MKTAPIARGPNESENSETGKSDAFYETWKLHFLISGGLAAAGLAILSLMTFPIMILIGIPAGFIIGLISTGAVALTVGLAGHALTGIASFKAAMPRALLAATPTALAAYAYAYLPIGANPAFRPNPIKFIPQTWIGAYLAATAILILLSYLSHPEAKEGKRAEPDPNEADTTAKPAATSTEEREETTVMSEVTLDGEGPSELPRAGSEAAPSAPKANMKRPPPSPLQKPFDLEKLLGGNIAVWAGAAAMGIGVLYLIKYVIENTTIPPGMRIVMGFAVSLALAGLAEWMRRSESRRLPFEAHIPTALASLASVSAFGTTYAAHSMYGFVNPDLAMALMALTGLAAITASLAYGPALGFVGIVGSYLTPIVFANGDGGVGLMAYLAVITASGLASARLQKFPALGAATLVGGVAWLYLSLPLNSPWPPGAMTLAYPAILAMLAAAWAATGDDEQEAVVGAAALLAATIAGAVRFGYTPTRLSGEVFTLMGLWLACAGWALAKRSGAAAAAVGALTAGFALIFWDGRINVLAASGEATSHTIAALVAGTATLALAVISILRHADRSHPGRAAARWHATVGGVGTAVLTACWTLGSVGLQSSYSAGGTALAVGALLAATAFGIATVDKHGEGWGAEARNGFLAGAAAALIVALGHLVPKIEVSMIFLTGAVASAWFAANAKHPDARKLPAAFAVLAVVATIFGSAPSFDGTVAGAAIAVVNKGVLGMVALFAATLLLQRRQSDGASLTTGVCGGLYTVITLVMGVRLGAYGPSFGLDRPLYLSLGESGGYVAILATCALIAIRFPISAKATQSFQELRVKIAYALVGLSIVAFLALPCFLANPLMTGRPVTGWPIFDASALAFLMPALIFGYVLVRYRDSLEYQMRPLMSAGFAIGVTAYAGIQIQQAWIGKGNPVKFEALSELERISYSAGVLGLAVLFLLLGILVKERHVRLAGLGLAVAATLKIFLYDLSGLEGILRPVSFLALGGALMGIGLLYQRLNMKSV